MVDSNRYIDLHLVQSNSYNGCDKLKLRLMFKINNAKLKILTLADSFIYNKWVLWKTLSIASVLIYLKESISTLEAVFIFRAKAGCTGWMTTNTYIVNGVIKKSYRFTITHTDIPILGICNIKHSWEARHAITLGWAWTTSTGFMAG